MYRMSQLIGGRKKQKSKMEAAWGTLDGTPPSFSSKKPTGKIPLPNSAASTSRETLEVTPLGHHQGQLSAWDTANYQPL